MSDSNDEQKLWHELDRLAFIASAFVIVVLSFVYFAASAWGPVENAFAIDVRSFILAIITNLIPTFLLFAGSYAVFRQVQKIRTKRESDQFVSAIVTGVRNAIESKLEDTNEQRTNFEEVRKGMATISKKLWLKGYRPDVIVSFTRSATALAGMLAVNMKVGHILSITRRLDEVSTLSPLNKKKYIVGEFLHLNKDTLKAKKLLVVFMRMETGEAIQDGLEYLVKEGMSPEDIEVAALYVAPGMLDRLPRIIYAYETLDPKGVLRRLPWIDEYDFI